MTLRNLKNYIFQSIAASVPFSLLRKRLPDRIVLYGHVVSDSDDLTARKYRYPNLREFAAMVEWWKNLGYKFSDIHTFMKEDTEKKILLTFDDGFKALAGDVRHYLKREHIPSVIFILTDTFANRSFGRKLLGAEHGTDLFLSEGEIRMLKDEGVHIGFHTRSHFRFENHHVLTDPVVAEQLTIPLEYSALLSTPRCFAYPYQAPEKFGPLDAFLKDAGYRWIFDTRGFRAHEGDHWFRVSIDAEITLTKRNWLSFSIRRQLLQHILNKRKTA